MNKTITSHYLALQDYQIIWQKMREFTDQRNADTADEIWLLEHPPVYTQGQNGKPEHILNAGDIPVIQVDRGGQVTYHGPGQLIAYPLIDLRRRELGVRNLVSALERSVIQLLYDYGITARARPDAPGVYVENAKICSLGLRIRRGCSFHGLALNVAMDLEPFSRINPCGYRDLAITQLKDFGINTTPEKIAPALVKYLGENLGLSTKICTL
jgi:lipoyl(octanoyl) transferase